MALGRENENKKIFRWWMIPLVFLFLLFVGISFFRLKQSRNVEARVAAIRAKGYPITLEELDAWHPTPPPGENAADIYLQAFAALGQWNWGLDRDIPTCAGYS